MNHLKKGQIEVTFNWIYVLIAGAVILLFFVGIIVKQKAASEEQLGSEVVRIMESIFTGAGVSEKTKNTIDTSGLADYTLLFSCDDYVGEYGIKGGSMTQNAIDPIFSPAEIRSSSLSLWSLPYKLPFKVIDFLFVTSPNTKYFLLGDTPFVEEFLNETSAHEQTRFVINALRVASPDQIDPGDNFQIRIVDFTGTMITADAPLPLILQSWDDTKVTAISFTASNQVDYYQKQGTSWRRLNVRPVQIVSPGGERDAAKYAAIFSGNDQIYECNMKKAFRRLQRVNEVYGGLDLTTDVGGKAAEMQTYYEVTRPELQPSHPNCLGYLKTYPEGNIITALRTHQIKTRVCLLESSSCSDLISSASELRRINELLRVDCLTLY